MNHENYKNAQKVFDEIVHGNMRKIRVMNNLTQQNIADLLQCSRSTYTYIENGNTTLSIYVLCFLANLYKMSLEELLFANIDFDATDKRPNKGRKKYQNPKTMGELSTQERELIAKHRHDTWEEWMRTAHKKEIAPRLDQTKG